MEQKQELEAHSKYYWNSQTGDLKQITNVWWLWWHSRQHLTTLDKVLRQNQKETPRIKDLLQEKWKKPVVCLKDLPQLKLEYLSLRIYQETTESLKQRENNNKQKQNVYIL